MTKIDNKATFEQGWLSLVLQEGNGHEVGGFRRGRGEFFSVTYFIVSKITLFAKDSLTVLSGNVGQWVL